VNGHHLAACRSEEPNRGAVGYGLSGQSTLHFIQIRMENGRELGKIESVDFLIFKETAQITHKTTKSFSH
jgi:hypothetical protein